MSHVLQCLCIALSLSLLIYVLYLVKRDKLQLRYSLLWLFLAVSVFFCSLIPSMLFELSQSLGFETPSNFIFFCAALVLLLISLGLSSIVSRQMISIKNLTQKIALLEHELTQDRPVVNDRNNDW